MDESRMDEGPRDTGDRDMLLQTPDLMLALLRAARSGPARLADAMGLLEANRRVARLPPPEDRPGLRRRLEQAIAWLQAAGAAEVAGEQSFRLTERGARLLEDNPAGIDDSVLERFAGFRRKLTAEGAEPPDDPRPDAFAAGLIARREGRAISDNPYARDQPDHLAWESGWSQGRGTG
jgi:hypothetical protein